MKFFAVLLLFFISCNSIAQCVHPRQDGTLIFTADTAASCGGYWLVPATEYTAYLSSVEISVAEISASFAWGLGTVVTFGFIGFVMESIRSTLRKL